MEGSVNLNEVNEEAKTREETENSTQGKSCVRK